MATKRPIKGIDKVLMFRKYEPTEPAEAGRLALQTSHTISESRDSSTTATKDGGIADRGALTTTIPIEAIASRDEVNIMLHASVKEDFLLEVWEIDFGADPVTEGEVTKYPARYGRGYLDSWESPASVDGHVTISTTFTVEGELVDGLATVSDQQIDELNTAFRDVVAQV